MSLLDDLRQANEAAKAERDRRKALKAWARMQSNPNARTGDSEAAALLERALGAEATELEPRRMTEQAAEELARKPEPRWKAAASPGGIAFIVILLLLFAYPYWLPGFNGSNFLTVQEILELAIIVTGLNIAAGFCGQLSLGQKIFVLVGGYAVGVFTTRYTGFFGDPWIGLILAVIIGMVIGALLGLPALRVKGAYLAIVTLAFVPIFFRIFSSDTFKGLFNGLQGLSDVKTPVGNVGRLPVRVINFPFSNRAMTDLDFYIFVVIVFGVVIFLTRNLIKSRWGRAMMSVRESEIAAKSSGVRVYRVKVAAFMISAAFATLAGALTTYRIAFISPTPPAAVHIRDSFTYVVMMIVGGTGTLAGPIVGAFTIQLIRKLTADYLQYQTIILAGLALFTVYTAPTGQVGVAKDLYARRLKRFRPRRKVPAPLPLPKAILTPHPREEVEQAGDVILETREMSKIFGGLRANDKVSISVRRETVHSLIGPNGSGKTTFINVVTGVYEPEEGEVSFAGERIDGRPAFVTVEKGMGRTFQNLQLWRRMSVVENVMVGLHVRARAGFIGNMIRSPLARREEADIKTRALGLLEFVGLEKQANMFAGQLPYGPQRYLEIARALALDPILLILDEPAAGLNPAEVNDLMGLIRRIKETGITVFLIEHHMDLVMGVSDQISVLDYGRKIADGTPAEVQANTRVIEAYLGAEMAEAMTH